METKKYPIIALSVFSLMAVMPLAKSQNYNWSGGGSNNSWSTPSNWEENAVPPTTSILYFGQSAAYTVNRDISGTAANQIIFEKAAESYDFTGNRIRLFGSGLQLVNYSSETQTFSNGLEIGSAGAIINTANGDIVIENGITGGNNRVPQKHGKGTLYIRGSSNVQLQTSIFGGTLSLDENAQSFGGINNVSFSPANTSMYEIVGSNTGTTSVERTALTINVGSGAGVAIRLNANGGSGVQLNFGAGTSALTWFGSSGKGNVFNLDISSSSGNQLSFASLNSNAALSASGIWGWASVTDTTGTGFGTLVGGNMVKNTVTSSFDGSSVTDTSTNYHVNGNANLTANRNVGSMTIQAPAGGQMTGNFTLTTGGVLMGEGSADYTISTAVWGINDRLYLHQHSIDGALVLSGTINRDINQGYLVKTGPGSVIVSETGRILHSTPTGIQGGKFVLNGQIEKSSEVNVFDGAVLEGSGSIGTVAAATVQIYGGGILQGNTSGALDITGSLLLDSYAHFSMTLDYLGTDYLDVSNTVTLNSEVNLNLELQGNPIVGEKVYLLKGGSIAGDFATINNQAFGVDGRFSLVWNATSYDFQLFNQNNEIWVEAIPEPKTAVLFGIALIIILISKRRSSSKIAA